MASSRKSRRPAPQTVYDTTAIVRTGEQVDLWEHATLLYYSFEWHAAADIFRALSDTLDSSRDNSQCCLNAALIHARLGDYPEATEWIMAAIILNPTCALAYFLQGIVDYELGHMIKAEACFELCVSLMQRDGSGFGGLHPIFNPSTSAILHNIEVTRAKMDRREDAGGSVDGISGLLRIPVECLFEAPPRDEEGELAHNAVGASSGLRRMLQKRLSSNAENRCSLTVAREQSRSTYGVPSNPGNRSERVGMNNPDRQSIPPSLHTPNSMSSVLRYYQGFRSSRPEESGPSSFDLRQRPQKSARKSSHRQENHLASSDKLSPIDEWLTTVYPSSHAASHRSAVGKDVEHPQDDDLFSILQTANSLRLTNQDSPSPAKLRRMRKPSPNGLVNYVQRANKLRLDNQDWKLPSRPVAPRRIRSDPVARSTFDFKDTENQERNQLELTSTRARELDRMRALRMLEGQDIELPAGTTAAKLSKLKRYCLHKPLPPLPGPSSTSSTSSSAGHGAEDAFDFPRQLVEMATPNTLQSNAILTYGLTTRI